MPTKKSQFDQMRAMSRGFAEGQLGPRPEREGNEPGSFERMSEEDQLDLMYRLQSLTAERRDLTRSLNQAREGKAEAPAAVAVKMFNGRPVRVANAPEQTAEAAGNPFRRLNQAAIEHAEVELGNVTGELAELGRIPGLHEAYEKHLARMYFFAKAAREFEKLKLRMSEIELEEDAIGRTARGGTAGAAVGVSRSRLSALARERTEIETKMKEQRDYFRGHEMERFVQMKHYAEALAHGRIIELPGTAELVENGLENMRAHQPYMLAGHLGSGKTEVARHMAKLFMLEQGVGFDPAAGESPDEVYDRLQPEMFSGAEEASVYDLIGKLKLTGKSVTPKLAAERSKQLADELPKHGVRGVPAEEITKILLGQGNVTETVFNYGPLGRALRDGKPIIIDEINLMPPEVVARINDLLLRPVGSKVRLQENGEEEFEIKPGFAVISTLNLGHQYHGIKEFNAAFASRWVGREVDYPSVEEDFDLILAALIRKDRTRLPPNFPPAEYDKLIELAVTAREVQELFSGKTEGQRFMARAHSVEAEKSQLEKVVISTRDLMRKIVEPWKNSDFKTPLDDIIAKNILAAAAIQSKDDQKFLAELFLRRGFFQGWKEERFRKAGVPTVSQKEIDALQVAVKSPEYKAADHFGTVLDSARNRANSIKADMLVGNRSV